MVAINENQTKQHKEMIKALHLYAETLLAARKPFEEAKDQLKQRRQELLQEAE